MELEIKHLLPYMGHNLLVMWEGVPCEVEGVDFHLKDTIIVERCDVSIKEVKPILRHISSIDDKITHDGVTFVPSEVLENMFGDISSITATMKVGSWIPQGAVRKLYEWHFDVDDIIEQGLAIDRKSLITIE